MFLTIFQKQLSKIVTPAYMGKINCADLDLGTQPPYFQSFHVLPKDSGFIWSFDSAIEYFGGAVIKIETNINARDFMSQESAENHSIEHTLSDEDILLGFDSIQKSTYGFSFATVIGLFKDLLFNFTSLK